MTASKAARLRQGAPTRDQRKQQHVDWLSLIDVTGPFLSVPVLVEAWPDLEGVSTDMRTRLRIEHSIWQEDLDANQVGWIDFVLRELLRWNAEVRMEGESLAELALTVPEHDATITPSFALAEPGSPSNIRLLGIAWEPGTVPTQRIKGDAWAATPVDRLAQLCRQHKVELGLATDGRWWALVWAPVGGVTTTAVFDGISFPESADRIVLRAFVSLLERRRFFGVPTEQQLPALLRESSRNEEEFTDQLGVQVRQAVEMLVAAIGRADSYELAHGGRGLADVPANDVYRSAVAVMMRILFLLYAEERGLLPSDSDVYVEAYSVGSLYQHLGERIQDAHGNEGALQQTYTAWHRLLALFTALYYGIDHPQMELTAYDGSLFHPDAYPWLEGRNLDSTVSGEPLAVDDRTVYHMLRAVQHVQVGKELRRVSFRTLGVEQIGYVYEGLLAYEGRRANGPVVSLIGKPGHEEEVELSKLEQLAASAGSSGLAAALAEKYKDSGIGSVKKLTKLLALAPDAQALAQTKLGAVTNQDAALVHRLLPFFGVIRTDMRLDPFVILPGAMYVTVSPLRKASGAHYTPAFLAEQVVEGAVEPLVYSPGPLQTADRDRWLLRSSVEILELKVADIAMGSGAFLVAACRYLADRLIEAWSAEGDERSRAHLDRHTEAGVSLDALADPLVIDARRMVIEHCLHGVDINSMAVEIAKLSLWLITMDPHRPFTFLDDRLVCGDSLLGITSLEQLEVMHLDVARGRELHNDTLVDFTSGIRSLIVDVAVDRRRLAEIPADSLAAVDKKSELLQDLHRKVAEASLYADLIVGASLASDTGHRRADVRHAGDEGYGKKSLFLRSAQAARGAHDSGNHEHALDLARRWQAIGQPDGAFDRRAIHWPLAFPEVFERGGFDAIIGNPPFLGSKMIRGFAGQNYREYLIKRVARNLKGNADIVVYFLLRAHRLLRATGTCGIVAKDTLAQGESQEVGLQQIIGDGSQIYRSTKSEPWPAKSASIRYCVVSISRRRLSSDAVCRADNADGKQIKASLDIVGRTSGEPRQLAGNKGLAFVGSYVLGMGFIVSKEEAGKLIHQSPKNHAVLAPYLTGEDLNGTHDQGATRWAINFANLTEDAAREYIQPFAVIRQQVKPERQRLRPDGSYALRSPLPQRYWQYADRKPALYEAVRGLDRVIAIALVSSTVMPSFVQRAQVFSNKVVVFTKNDPALLAALSSAFHYWWIDSNKTTHGQAGDTQYTPSRTLETWAMPTLTSHLRELGIHLDHSRILLMSARECGLTHTYRLVNDSNCKDGDIIELRAIHRQIDHEVTQAYGWGDLELDHRFYETRLGIRYTVGPVVRQEILDRLLELNHERYAEEVAAGLHDKRGKKTRKVEVENQDRLFGDEGRDQ